MHLELIDVHVHHIFRFCSKSTFGRENHVYFHGSWVRITIVHVFDFKSILLSAKICRKMMTLKTPYIHTELHLHILNYPILLTCFPALNYKSKSHDIRDSVATCSSLVWVFSINFLTTTRCIETIFYICFGDTWCLCFLL